MIGRRQVFKVIFGLGLAFALITSVPSGRLEAQTFGTSANPTIVRVTVADSTETTWTGPTGPVSKILIGQQTGTPFAFRVAYVSGGTTGTAYRAHAAGTTFAADGIQWSGAKLYIYQSSTFSEDFYVEYWR